MNLVLELPAITEYQDEAIFCRERNAIIEATTKAGKTVGCLYWLVHEAGKRAGEYWWVAPVYPQAEIAYRRAKAMLIKVDPERKFFAFNETKLSVLLPNKAIIRFRTGDDPDNLYGEDVYAAVIDEASRCKEAAWHAVRSTLTATRGRVRIIGNVRGNKNWAYTLARRVESGELADWRYAKITAADAVKAGVIDADEVEAARDELPPYVFKELYLAEPCESDNAFFPSAMIAAHKAEYAREPLQIGAIGTDIEDIFERDHIISNRLVNKIRWQEDRFGPFRFWEWWDGDRPNQEFAYCMGIDLGYGVGSSNTVFSIANADTREKIGEFASPSVTPEEAAAIAALTGYWIGGRLRSALINFESNGPGEVFAKHIQRLKYGNLYREKAAPSAVESQDPGRIGWRSGPTAKEYLLGDYRAALAAGRFRNPSARALDECLTYQVDSAGRVQSHYEASEDDGTGARVPHGDFVIGDALAWLACLQIGRLKPPEMPVIAGTLSAVLKKKHDARLAKDRW